MKLPDKRKTRHINLKTIEAIQDGRKKKLKPYQVLGTYLGAFMVYKKLKFIKLSFSDLSDLVYFIKLAEEDYYKK